MVPSHLQDRVVWRLPGSLIAEIRGTPCVRKSYTLMHFRNWFYMAIKKRAGVGWIKVKGDVCD